MSELNFSLSLSENDQLNGAQKLSFGLFSLGFFLLFIMLTGAGSAYSFPLLMLSMGLIASGALIYMYKTFGSGIEGIKNNGIMFAGITSRGLIAWGLGVVLTAFYIVLYWFPQYISAWISMLEPLSQLLRGRTADHWFMYGFFYTIAILIMGVRTIMKYRHVRYQFIRTVSVMFFQLVFAFLIPAFLQLMNEPEFYFSYFYPLKPDYLFPSGIDYLTSQPGAMGTFMVFWGAMMTFFATPVLTYYFGKRWYCSWVCGCGGLAETAGDPFRHLSDKSLKAWQIERYLVHSVLVFIVITTLLLWANSYYQGELLGSLSSSFSSAYGFYIGAIFSGVVGVGFYPVFGSRVWCRFGCPMAAILGIQQKYFSRFRITTNGGQCISCGNCSTYCEMGIDVRAYAQKGQNIVRASCVGCGICSAVCPRGVLNLENGSSQNRVDDNPIIIGNDGVSIRD